MALKTVNVLVVDDSTFIRRAIIRMLKTDPRLVVVGEASDGQEALNKLAELAVDVVTLDLEMPGMDGLTTLRRIRSERGVPVIILSGAAGHGAAVTLQALDLGAFDVVAKPDGGPLAIHAVTKDLVAKIRAATGLDGTKPLQLPPNTVLPGAPAAQAAAPARRAGSGGLEANVPAAPPASPAPRGGQTLDVDLVAIGISTGGPPALQRVIPALPADFPVPVVVLQHMPPGYTRALAERLDKASRLTVKEAEDGDELVPGRVLIAPAGFQLGFKRGGNGWVVAISETCPIPSYYRPCIDHTYMEAAKAFGARTLGVVMTGMGSDGSKGLVAIRQAGGHGWAQDEATSVIYGMPLAAKEAGAVEEEFSLDQLADHLASALTPAPRRKVP